MRPNSQTQGCRIKAKKIVQHRRGEGERGQGGQISIAFCLGKIHDGVKIVPK
jgi:hypothetical protein